VGIEEENERRGVILRESRKSPLHAIKKTTLNRKTKRAAMHKKGQNDEWEELGNICQPTTV